MAKDSILMHYLESLVSVDARNSLSNDSNKGNFFVVERLGHESLNDVLQKKIQVIKNIQAINNEDPKKAAAFFAPFASNYWVLQRAKDIVLKSYLLNIANGTQRPDEKVLLEIADKMIITALLQAAVFRDRYNLRGELVILEQVLYDLSSEWSLYNNNIFQPFDSKLELYKDSIEKPNSFVAKLSERHNDANILRFFILRLWRWVNVQLIKAFAYCTALVNSIKAMRENGLGVFLSYFAWMFFIPRIFVNLCTVIYSLIGTSSIFGKKQLPAMEKEYGWYLRLKIRLNAIFYEMANDWMWFFSGIVNCFSLAGTLPIIGVFIMIAAQAYDFTVIMLRNFLDGMQLNKFKHDMLDLQDKNKLNDADSFINNLQKRIESDKKVLLYAIFNFAVLLVCIAFMTPAFGNISPFIPLIASLITVIVAPLRGYTINYFKKAAKKAKPSLIGDDTYGLVIVSTEDFKYDEEDELNEEIATNESEMPTGDSSASVTDDNSSLPTESSNTSAPEDKWIISYEIRPVISPKAFSLAKLKAQEKILGRYTKGLVCVKNIDNQILKIYEYNEEKGKEKLKELDNKSCSSEIFGPDLNVYQRVKTVDRDFIKRFKVKFLDEINLSNDKKSSVKVSVVGGV